MEDLLLLRWSSAVQITSSLMLGVFFIAIGRSAPLRGLRWWVVAWSANAVALLVTGAFWVFQPGPFVTDVVTFFYIGSKTLFVALLLYGTLVFVRPTGATPRSLAFIALPLLWGLIGAWWMDTINAVGLSQALIIAVAFVIAAVLCWRSHGLGLGWLGVGFFLRALLAIVEGASYYWRMDPENGTLPGTLRLFLSSHSAFDTGAEWLIALGCVLALAHRSRAEIANSHAELHAAHVELQRVAERDPLTGLYNRRMLTELLTRQVGSGAHLLFFDLDDFKRINDRDGHNVGDASLRRFADVLQAELPDAHAVLRFAGDEFLAIVPLQSADVIAQRIAHIRARLEADDPAAPPLRFSVGVRSLDAGADPQHALREADLAMYEDKARRRGVRA